MKGGSNETLYVRVNSRNRNMSIKLTKTPEPPPEDNAISVVVSDNGRRSLSCEGGGLFAGAGGEKKIYDRATR